MILSPWQDSLIFFVKEFSTIHEVRCRIGIIKRMILLNDVSPKDFYYYRPVIQVIYELGKLAINIGDKQVPSLE